MVARVAGVTVIGVALLGGCSAGRASGTRDGGRDAAPDVHSSGADGDGSFTFACPTEPESGDGKIRSNVYVQTQPNAVYPVAVWLKSPEQISCGASSADPMCSDAALANRQALNAKMWECVGAWLGGQDAGRTPQAQTVWYENPSVDSSGQPAPVATAFAAPLSVSQIQMLATSPLVAAIDPMPGRGAGVPVSSFVVPEECPAAGDDPAPKLSDATSIQGAGRQAVVVDYVDDGYLPPDVSCPNPDDLCSDRVHRLWLRTILNTRAVSCVNRWLDTQLTSPPSPVSYATAQGTPLAPSIPPFGQGVSVLESKGMGLTWDEATVLARHPYVARIWVASGVQIDPDSPGCPPDLTSPISATPCTDTREDVDGKFSSHGRMVLEQSSGAVQVTIQVEGGAMVCDVEHACATDPSCPSLDAIHERWRQENVASQQCVRSLIDSLGGQSADAANADWLVDAFVADLTWPQILEVAGYPSVLHIEPNVE
jgi:hypothetical protein